MMLRAIIVEDEPGARKLLQFYLEKFCPQVKIIALAPDAKMAYEVIVKEKPNLLFLDIEIANEHSPESSFDLLARLPKYEYQVIFVTAFDHYALKAIQFCALDYLLKPIDIDKLETAVARAEKQIILQKHNEQLEDLKRHIRQPAKLQDRIWVPMSNAVLAILLKDIIRLEAESRYTYIFTLDGQKILSTKNLKEYINILDGQHFFQPHRSHLLNVNHIEKYANEDGGSIVMKDQSVVPLARRRKQAFIHFIGK